VGNQYYGEQHVKKIIDITLSPGEKRGFDGHDTFLDTLAFAIYLKDDGKLLLEALRKKWPEAVESSMEEAKELARNLHPAWGEHHSAEFVRMTVPPGEERHGFDDRYLFIDILALSIALKEDGKILLETLRKKWPEAVESSMEEATRLAQEATAA